MGADCQTIRSTFVALNWEQFRKQLDQLFFQENTFDLY